MKKDLRSKIFDGLCLPMLILLINFILHLVFIPISNHFGNPGELVFEITLMIVGVILLDRALISRYPNTLKAWLGILSGVFGWKALALITDLQLGLDSIIDSILLLIFIGLITAVLWRRVFPVGMQFFTLLIILSWGGNLIHNGLTGLSNWSTLFTILTLASGIIAILIAIFGEVYVFTKPDWRMQRIHVAVWIWFLLNYAGMIFIAF